MNTVEVSIDLRDDHVFKKLFTSHFKELHAYAYSLIKDWDLGAEIVQSVYMKLWERKDKELLSATARAFLYKMVYHECLNDLRSQKVRSNYESYKAYSMKDVTDDASDRLKLNEVQQRLRAAINKLPEKCRVVFHLSRFEELKYKEIADKMGISIKTVETQMVKALKVLRVEMSDFLPVIIAFIFNFLDK